MDRAIFNLNNTMITAKSGTVDTLKEQTQEYAAQLQEQLKRFNETGEEIYKVQSENMEAAVNESIRQLRELDPQAAAEMGTMVRNMKDFYSDAKNTGDYIGGGVGDGVVSGISSKTSGVQRAVQNILNAARQKARAMEGISSPSKRWRKEIGQQISAGMALGIEDGEPLVEDATAGLMSAAENAMDYGYDYDVQSVDDEFAANNITIVVNGAEGQDVGSLAEEVAIRLQRMYKREVVKYA